MEYKDNVPGGQHTTAESTVESNAHRGLLQPYKNNINRPLNAAN